MINSAVVKLCKLTVATTVYRGLGNGILPDEFWDANEYGVCGGIEYAFMSTTLDREVAFAYAKSARTASTILEIKSASSLTEPKTLPHAPLSALTSFSPLSHRF